MTRTYTIGQVESDTAASAALSGVTTVVVPDETLTYGMTISFGSSTGTIKSASQNMVLGTIGSNPVEYLFTLCIGVNRICGVIEPGPESGGIGDEDPGTWEADDQGEGDGVG